MNNTVPFEDFFYDPNTVDFVVRDSAYMRSFIKERPQIKAVYELGDRFLIIYTTRSYATTLIEDLGTAVVRSTSKILGLLDRTNLEAAGIIQIQEQPFLELKGKGVIVGIIDTGIDYTKSAFINEDGTSKIRYLFDFTIRSVPPEGYFVGTEYTNEQINQALKSDNPFDIVPSKDTVGHGTFLASVAAGRDEGSYIGAAPEAELIVVKLKKARPFYLDYYLVPPDQENAFESTSVMVGIEYILKKAQELNKPVAICIGLGTNIGGHDGFTLFEEFLAISSNIPGVCICTAVGNESQARHHTQGVIPAVDEFIPIDVKVGENAGNVYLNIYNNVSDRVSIAVRSPTGELVGRFPAKSGSTLRSKLVLEKSTVILGYFFPLEGSGAQTSTVRILDATPGIWTILVYGDIILDGVFHSWLPITGFISPNVEFLTPTPYYTVVVPSTALGVIKCGAYDSATNSLYINTSWGPTRLPIMSPDFVAPGVNVGGVYPSGYGTMSGTSVSAAITTGACALMLQWGIVEGNDLSMSTYQARAYIIRGCERDPKLIYPNTQWGYGQMNLYQSFDLMRS